MFFAINLDGYAIRRPCLTERSAQKECINRLAWLDGIGMHYYVSRNYSDLIGQVDFHIGQLIAHLK
jgi:hypothetical protein